ncbi:MAG TPA: hypothetical protein VID77_08270 [Stellaceae bacterium]|jgi:hypothetical protein
MIRADRAAWRPELIALLAAAALARLAVFYLAPNVHWPDEIYQALEPAHRLVFGTGAVAWEWTLGARSWLLPGFVAALMEVGRLIGDSHTAIDFPVHLFMAAAGCAPVACAYCWGRRFAGRAGGFVAGAVPALWVDSIYLSGHTLAEVLAADCLPVALYLGLPASGVASRARLWLAGAFLGLTFDLRYHLAAALAVAALAILWRRGGYRQWLALIAGACGPVLAMGLLDWATLGHPFQSIFLNLAFNVAQGGDYAGRSSWLTLIVLPVYLWHAGAIAMLTAAAIGTRRLPSAALVAIAIFATYSFVAHKEYRFIYPALVLIAILAGIGSAEILRAARAAWPQALSSGAVAASALTLFWLAISIAIAQSPIYRDAWTRARGQLLAFNYASRQPDLCGVGLYGMKWPVTPGQTALPPTVRLYQSTRSGLMNDAPAFNYLVTWGSVAVPASRYRRAACFDGDAGADGTWQLRVCVWRRDGGCDASAAPPFPVNWPGTLAGKTAMGEEYDWVSGNDR